MNSALVEYRQADRRLHGRHHPGRRVWASPATAASGSSPRPRRSACRRRRSGCARTSAGCTCCPGRRASRAPTRALTGARFGPADAIAAGLADISSRRPAGRADRAAAGTAPFRSDMRHRRSGSPSRRPASCAPAGLDRQCYAGDDVERDPAPRCWSDPEAAAQASGETLAAMSPTALKVTLRAVRRAAVDDAGRGAGAGPAGRPSGSWTHPDLAEGIRAQVIDKDRQPRWKPARLDEVSDEQCGCLLRTAGPRTSPGGEPDRRTRVCRRTAICLAAACSGGLANLTGSAGDPGDRRVSRRDLGGGRR